MTVRPSSDGNLIGFSHMAEAARLQHHAINFRVGALAINSLAAVG
jgi:hypothetical protein